jgi:DNA-binding MarR family transcriptional regulator
MDRVTPDFADPRITAIGLFAEAFAGLTGRFATEFERHKVSAVEFEVLLRLARTPGQQLRMTDLAAQTTLSTSGVTRVVDRLDRDGLVCRQACRTDRRASYATLTDAGRTRLQDILPTHLRLIEEWFTGQLTPEQLATFLDTLRTLRDAMNPCATAGATTQDAAPTA